jgi:hypothetical protein
VLSKLGSDRASVPLGVFIHELHRPSIKALDSSSSLRVQRNPTKRS